MSGDKVIQTRCTSALLARIEKYKNNEELSTDSAAVRKLVTFALDIIDSSADAPAVSNRELMEEMFSIMHENAAMICQSHTHVYDRSRVTSEISESAKISRIGAKEFGRDRAETFLSGGKTV